jgi:hypothetical protein
VNPIVAVLLGVWLGRETLSEHAAVGGGLIVLAVIVILRAPRPRVTTAPVEPPALPVAAGPVHSAVER